MKWRTPAILAVIAAVLLTYILVFERHQATTDELNERNDRVIPDFDRDRVNKITLGHGDDRVVLVREEPEEEPDGGILPGEVGEWKITHPRELEADSEAVDSLLSTLDWLERRRSVELSKVNKTFAELGLTEPRGQISIKLRNREVTLKVGNEAPGKGLYVAMGDQDDRAFVVDLEFLEQISKEANDLRNKKMTSFETGNVNAIRIKGRFHAKRTSGDSWSLNTPVRMSADGSAIEDVIREIEGLRAKRFIADDVEEGQLSQYGLDRPQREVVVSIDDEDENLVLSFGGDCEGHDGEIYATKVGTGAVACVEREILDGIGIDPDTLRNMRPTDLDEDDLDGLIISRGKVRVELRRHGNNWHIGESENDPEADQETIETFLTALGEAQASDVSSDMETLGLSGDDPQADATVRMVHADDDSERLLYFAIGENNVFLRRGTEGVALVLPVDVEGVLQVDGLHFRKRQVVNQESTDATEVELVSGRTKQVVRQTGLLWNLVEPFEFEADNVVVRQIIREFSELRAERFVAAAPSSAHGLNNPRHTLRIRFEPEEEEQESDAGTDAASDAGQEQTESVQERTILIGSETDGGYFARLGGEDQTVFVVDGAFVSRFEDPLLDRNVFMIEEDEVRRLIIERSGAETVEIERHEGSWRTGETEAPEGAVDALLSRLAVARATDVIGLGPASPAFGLNAPRARLRVFIGESEERVFIIGNEYTEEDSQYVYVRREGVDATFSLSLRTVRPILEYGQESEE